MTNTPDHPGDDVIASFLRARSADADPGLLDDILHAVDATPQDRPWLSGRSAAFPRRAWMMIAIAMLVVAMGAVGVGALLLRPDVTVVPLPTTPDAWTRVVIDVPAFHRGSVVSIAANPNGLIAVISDDVDGVEETQLAISTDGRAWTIVPADRRPDLINPRNFGYPFVLGTDDGFLLLQLGRVWASERGDDWRLIATADNGVPNHVAVGGPGLVGVGDDSAWYSLDGTEWSLAEVPPLPASILELPESDRYVGMRGVTGAANALVAWGVAEVPLAENSGESLEVALLWASQDGRTWTDVRDPQMDSVTAVAGGAGGFVASGIADGAPALWFSSDGRAWERIANAAVESRWPAESEGPRTNKDPGDVPVDLVLGSAAAGAPGFAVVGGDGLCGVPFAEGFCGSDEAVIWLSADGTSWSRVGADERFTDGYAAAAVAWGKGFVVGGVQRDAPAIWISDSAP